MPLPIFITLYLLSLLLCSHLSSLDSFPRLDPPPPSGKKRLPRALKTTQDMMISSDPVVSTPDAADSSALLPSAEISEPLAKEEPGPSKEEQEQEEEAAQVISENKADGDCKTTESKVESIKDGKEDDVANGGEGEEPKLQLSVPDLINKDPPPACDVWQKAPGPDSRLASTPYKTPCRISLGEDVLLGNGAPCSKGGGVGSEEAEPHPDLLSFE